jgi:hypothetical protein
MDFSQSIITVLTGLIGVLCGTSLSSYFNLKSSRKDLLFKRKLEYFEKLVRDLEDNFRLHKKSVLFISPSTKKRDISRDLEELKKNRKSFLIAASPLYFNVERMTPNITNFVNTEKNIFSLLEKLVKVDKGFSRQRIIFELRESLQRLDMAKQAAILEMRRELYHN